MKRDCSTETRISKYRVKKFYVYQLRLENSDAPFYVGKGSSDRVRAHFRPRSLKSKSRKNSIIRRAIASGEKVMSDVLAENMSESDAFAMEVELIKKYGRRDNGTGILANHTDGGDGSSGVKHNRSPAYRENVRLSRLGKKASTAAREKMASKNWDRRPDLWLRADELHGIFSGLSDKTSYFLAKAAGLKPAQLERMTGKFKEGWNPLESPEWLQWRQAIVSSSLKTSVLESACLPA